MKFFIFAAFCIAACLAADADVQILKNDFENVGLDGYKYAYELSDGQSRVESAIVKNFGSDAEALEVKGTFSFIGDDGQTYKVDYIANENGFQPSAPHLPVAPVV